MPRPDYIPLNKPGVKNSKSTTKAAVLPTSGTVRSKLVSMKTDFRTLKYSGDLKNGGTSGQPYIQTPLDRSMVTPNPAENSKFPDLNGLTLYDALDKQRIGRYLANNPQGKLFAAKQKELQLVNPKMEVGFNFNSVDNTGKGFLASIINNLEKGGGLEFTRIYNDNGNLLQQVGSMGRGYHFDYSGASAVVPFQSKYFYTATHKTKDQNRLVLLYGNKIEQTKFRGINDVSPQALSEINKLGISRSQNKLFEYVGGPNSGGDSTWTVLQRYDYTNTWASFSAYSNKQAYEPGTGSLLRLLPRPADAVNISSADVIVALKPGAQPGSIIRVMGNSSLVDPSNSNYILSHRAYVTSSFVDNETVSPINKAKTLSYDQIIKRATSLNTEGLIGDDFRIAAGAFVSSSGYEGDIGSGYLDKVYGVGNPGNLLQKRVSYGASGYSTAQADSGVDQVNLLDVGDDYGDGSKDLIKCKISAVETQQNTDTLTNVIVPIVFRAFVTSFTDNINANYNEYQYVGRGEKFYTYNSSDRKVNFQLAIAAQSRVEMRPLYRKLNYLVSQLYPGYSGTKEGTGNGFLRAPLVKMTIGDYLFDQPGFLNSISISIPDDSPWEIKAEPNGQDADMYQLPHYLQISIQFTPIHNFIARRGFATNVTNAGTDASIPSFITPNERVNGSSTNLFGIGQ